jgi:secreted PhoX family phosphatase
LGQIRLVRNHEDRNGPGAGSTGGPASKKYDALGGGGTTTLSINPKTRKLVKDFVSLTGTIVNCAGGLTPWNSWLTCEETVAGVNNGWQKPHGYVFDVPAFDNGTANAVPFPLMGRFAHEAVAVDPKTWIIYETEDAGSNSGFYRYLAKRRGRLQEGKLQMLAIDGAPNYDTRTDQTVGTKLKVKWVDVPDPDSDLEGGAMTCFAQGFANGGARFARLEGCWYGNGSIFFNSTSGGNAGQGQVWEYDPDHGGTVRMIFESPNANVLNAPDNLTVSPNGGLLLCEDGDGDQFLRGLTKKGEIFDFSQNLQDPDDGSEWAGATFAVTYGDGDHNDDDYKRRDYDHGRDSWWDDDGRDRDRGGRRITLFVNRQGTTSGANPPASDPGMTFAIWGPWQNGAL